MKIIKLAKDIIKYIPRYIIVVKRINESTISSLHEKANPIADNARRNSFASSISDSINSIPESARLCLLLRVIESSVIRYEGYLEQLDPLNSVLHSNLLGKSKQQKEIDSNLEKEISCIVNDTTELALNLLPSFRRELAKFYATKINSLSSESSVTGNEVVYKFNLDIFRTTALISSSCRLRNQHKPIIKNIFLLSTKRTRTSKRIVSPSTPRRIYNRTRTTKFRI